MERKENGSSRFLLMLYSNKMSCKFVKPMLWKTARIHSSKRVEIGERHGAWRIPSCPRVIRSQEKRGQSPSHDRRFVA
eukprot:scaffold320_cov335-Pavlova_lutheri.AAC.6